MIISLSSSPPLIMKLSVECVCMKSESVCCFHAFCTDVYMFAWQHMCFVHHCAPSWLLFIL